MVVVVLAAGCQCERPLDVVAPESIVVAPLEVDFGEVRVGASGGAVLSVSNVGGRVAELEVSTSAPFSSSTGSLSLARGATDELVLTFTPVSTGTLRGRVQVGPREVALRGVGVAAVECSAAACVDAVLEPTSGVCVHTRRPDGASCASTCVVGQCSGTQCLGQPVDCDDDDACTLDACDEARGCAHSPRQCAEAASPCEVARCDPTAGCLVAPADDGTLCGADDCASAQVSVCIAGQCVERARPAQGRCANRWKPLAIPTRYWAQPAWDPVRRATLIFGGAAPGGSLRSDTWSFDGTGWTQLFPAQSPPASGWVSMATDLARGRIVLLRGDPPDAAETWEWTGTTWLSRSPAQSPPGRFGHAMAFDAARRRVVMFGGNGSQGLLNDTWEWDGAAWSRRTTAHSPSPRTMHQLAWDEGRQRIVLVGGASAEQETWEYDGVDWALRASSRPDGQPTALTWDGVRQTLMMLVVTGGTNAVWDWSGTEWTQSAAPMPSPSRSGSRASWDPDRRKVVLFGSLTDASTWQWDGAAWVETPRPTAPPGLGATLVTVDGGVFGYVGTSAQARWFWDGLSWRSFGASLPARVDPATAWDAARGRLVLYGGGPSFALRDDTWEWDGADWRQADAGQSPRPSQRPRAAYDMVSARVVLLTRPDVMTTPETWTWDGLDWVRRSTANALPALGPMVWHPPSQRLLAFSGGALWSLEATDWQSLSAGSGPTHAGESGLAWDPVREVVLFFGAGQTWEWSANVWRRLNPVDSPVGGSPAWDPVGRQVLLVESGTTWVFVP